MDVRLVVERGGRGVFRMRSQGGTMIIGRQKGCGLRVPSADVSRRHCRLVLADGFLTLEDLGSANGTYLNDQPISEKMSVRPGDRLRIGPVTFVVEYELDQDALDRLRAWEQARRAVDSVPELELADDEAPTRADVYDPSVPLQMSESDPDLALPVLEEELIEPEVFDIDNEAPMQLPAADQLRDFLSQLEEAADE